MLLKVFIILTISIWTVGACGPTVVPGYLAIYYGWPSVVQGSNGNLTAACNWFKQFDLIVLGDTLEYNSHPDHNRTIPIIQCLIASNKKVYGYVDLGVNGSTQNQSITQMQTAVNAWKNMSANGIFWDDAGYDYGVTRTRQTTMVNYCHGLNMNVIMNAWNPDDVMAGPNCSLNANDTYIAESFLVGNGTYQNLTNWKAKADKCANYSKTLGVKIACLSTPNASNSDQYNQAWMGAAMYNCDYFQATDINYSSNAILNYKVPPSTSYGKNWQTDYIIVSSNNQNYSRSTELYKALVSGDGASWGWGSLITPP